jgi:hypothetical protein
LIDEICRCVAVGVLYSHVAIYHDDDALQSMCSIYHVPIRTSLLTCSQCHR